jgi:uncharacterized protein YjiS (DUF1127 family)
MREYVLSRAIAQAEAPVVTFLKNIRRNWAARRRVANLADFDDHMLRDIGVTRSEIEWAAGLPLTVNAALALEEKSFRRRRHGERALVPC